MYDLIVIGSGPGGYEAAAHAGKLGKKTALVERDAIGGVCLNVGCIPTKTLLRSAKAYVEAKHADSYGVSVKDVAFHMDKVQARKASVVAQLTKGVEGLLKKSKVEIIKGTAKFVSKNEIDVGGVKYQAANFLIATGSAPARPPIPGIEGNAKVVDSTGILALDKVPARLVVIGGGVIGLEFASFFASVGSKVTVIEMLGQIAGNTDGDMAKRLQAALEKDGVTFALNAKVVKVDGGAVTYQGADGAETKAEGDVVLLSTGRRPVTETVGLEAAGVDYDRKGVKVDAYGRTNVTGIWACGDVTGRCLLAHSATREGLVAVNSMFGAKEKMSFAAIPGVIYTHPEVAGVGKTEEQLTAEGVPFKKAVVPMAVAGRYTVEQAHQQGTVKILAGEHGQILGVHMIGDPAGEIIHGAVALIENEALVGDLARIVFPHPTVSEALREAILSLAH